MKKSKKSQKVQKVKSTKSIENFKKVQSTSTRYTNIFERSTKVQYKSTQKYRAVLTLIVPERW